MEIKNKIKKMKKEGRKDKKGFVLSLDALFAVLIVVTALIFATSYVPQQKEKIFYLYNEKAANDAFAVLDYNNILQTKNPAIITQEMNKLLSSSEFKLNMTTCDVDLSGKSSMTFGSTPQNSSFVMSGKRFFTIKNNGIVTGFGAVSYNVWQK